MLLKNAFTDEISSCEVYIEGIDHSYYYEGNTTFKAEDLSKERGANMPDKNWKFELEEYIKQGEPERAEKSEAWQTAIGLQAVDGLNTSDYLLDTAKEHIEGKITIDEAQKRIHSYYKQHSVRTKTENETKEADIVSARIAKLLGEKAFQFSPAEWLSIHRRLFEDV